MLQAILHGKIGMLFEKGAEGESFKERFRTLEDFLTAAVFERLRYLPANLFWKVLSEAAIPVGSLPMHVGNLRESEFWPTWDISQATSDRMRCIPDVFLSFEKIDIAVEAKLNDGQRSQDAQQLALEWLGYNEEIEGRQMWLMMVSGLEEVTDDCVIGFRRQIEEALRNLGRDGARVQLVGTSWQLIAKALKRVVSAHPIDANILTVINDILEAFQLYNVQSRQPTWLESLRREARPFASIRDESLEQFAGRISNGFS
ncbi:MAG TPA: hypothetical protein PK224_02305 [Nitrospira sp.]|nr:hypothetical protein [Nitrospira sp.]